MEMMLNKIVPEGLPYRHSCEGPDDMVRRIFQITKKKKKEMHINRFYLSILYL